MIVTRVYMRDVRLYEENNNINILKLFESVSVENIITCLKLFNHIDENEACDLLDKYMESDGIGYVYNALINAFIGYDYTEDKNDGDDDSIDLTKFNYMYEYYDTLCMQLMALGLSYSEFWNLSTREVYSTSKALQQKIVIDYNMASRLQYQQACLTASAFVGKLPKEAPHISVDSVRRDDEIINTEYGEMTYRDYKSVLALKKLGGGVDE